MIPNEYWCYSWMCKHVNINIKLLQYVNVVFRACSVNITDNINFFLSSCQAVQVLELNSSDVWGPKTSRPILLLVISQKARNVQWSESVASLLQISVLMGEPYFSTSLLPWHSLFFWYCRTALAGLLRPNATILPCSATLHMVAVEFQVRQRGIFSYI